MDDVPRPVIARFGREFLGAEETLTRIGGGDLGGKASGLHLIRERILPRVRQEEFPLFEVSVPTATVLTTEIFDAFMEHNSLYGQALSDLPDDRIAHSFQRADLPAQYVGDLRALIATVHTPLAVRSSSLLEDALDHPFAGVYATKMIPNNEIDADARFRRLVEAIRFVYASTFFAGAKGYMRSIGHDIRGEKMAVIIQEVVGQRAADRFYPCISGVARSFNYYPSGSSKPEEGVVYLALGLGKTIVDGGASWGYAPGWPKAPPPFNDIADLLKNTQTEFWTVNMGPPPIPDPITETECMLLANLGDAESDGALKYLVSTYDSGSDRLYPGLGGSGPRALDFAPVLGSRTIPLNDLVRRLLEAAEESLGGAVELEFAVNLDRRHGLPARLGFLQVRPMMVATGDVDVTSDELLDERAVVATNNVLGNGIRDDIRDVIYIKPAAFEPASTHQMASELDTMNRGLVTENRPYLLIGFGRWGTSDARLGIPVVWGQISNARVIVEATLPDVNPDLSQGSHFFHNLLSFQVLYLSVEHQGPCPIDWQWLARQETVNESRFVKHIRLASPLDIRVDGRSRRGVVKRP